jgi:hypothetical protein
MSKGRPLSLGPTVMRLHVIFFAAFAASGAHASWSSSVWPTWSDSDLLNWVESHSVAGPLDTIRERSTLLKEIKRKYWWDEDTMWTAWSDSQMRNWLIERGYLRADVQKTRDELMRFTSQKVCGAVLSYSVCISRSSSGTIIQPGTQATYSGPMRVFVSTYALSVINDGIATAEQKLKDILALLTGTADLAPAETRATYEDGKVYAHEKVA